MSNITIRASAWGGFFDCAHKFEWEHLLKHRKAAGLRALLGTAVHAGTAAFDQARLQQAPILPDDAADAFVESLRTPEYDVDYKQDDLKLQEAERIGLTLVSRYCTTIAPQFDFIAVEMALEPLVIDCGGGTTVTLTGTMDRARVAATDDGVVIPDVKTGRAVVNKDGVSTKARAPQLGTYQLMYENTAKEPTVGSQIIGLGTTAAAPVGVSHVFDARTVMLGDGEQRGLIQYAAEMFRAGMFPPNPSSPLCSPKYCARWSTCLFHS
ncbi:PD-(D/E)XK nuclease family protein [Robbsia sp. KACC 23696]|uniref:PD-(D/E)XK nuclease family protein n=1 Tax=Robbsia sp. KACC 23696 TaxID=3149231 RepID=UPI00325B3E05